jgi:hypothetical protein
MDATGVLGLCYFHGPRVFRRGKSLPDEGRFVAPKGSRKPPGHYVLSCFIDVIYSRCAGGTR